MHLSLQTSAFIEFNMFNNVFFFISNAKVLRIFYTTQLFSSYLCEWKNDKFDSRSLDSIPT